jgi:hypothetical protein
VVKARTRLGTRVDAAANIEVVESSRRQGVGRLLTVGLIGATSDLRNAWVRARAHNHQYLLSSGLDVTILRAGQIAGIGSVAFDAVLAAAGKGVTTIRGTGRQRWSCIAQEDLVGYLVAALDEPLAYGRPFDVGSTETRRTAGRARPVPARSARWPRRRRSDGGLQVREAALHRRRTEAGQRATGQRCDLDGQCRDLDGVCRDLDGVCRERGRVTPWDCVAPWTGVASCNPRSSPRDTPAGFQGGLSERRFGICKAR